MKPKIPQVSAELSESLKLASDTWHRQLEQISVKSTDIFNVTALTEASKRISEEFLRPWKEMQERSREQAEALGAVFKKFESPEIMLPSFDFNSMLEPVFHDFEEATRGFKEFVDAMPARARHDLPILAARGWYMGQEMAARAPSEMAREIEAGDTQAVDDFMVEHFQDRARNIRADLTAKYPHRERFLSKAFDAHERGEFELSIPVFLAQADGICSDRTAKLLFQRENKRPQIAVYIASVITDAYQAALLSPLTENHAISLSKGERPANFDGLNRHQVLHGESLDYPTEINSLKAISLLNYLSWVLHFSDEDSEESDSAK